MVLTRVILILSIFFSMSSFASITEGELDSILKKFKEIYSSEMQQATFKDLVFKKDFRKNAVRAYIQQKSLFYLVTIEKGLIDNEAMTADGVALVICHELGHALGGAPYKKKQTIDDWGDTVVTVNWASAEGQSDYFATSDCMKRYFNGDYNEDAIEGKEIPSVITKSCNMAYKSSEDRAICKRTSLAIPQIIYAINFDNVEVSLSTPNRSERETTSLGYPDLQCRMDTYFNGALGAERPRCWYKPGHPGNPTWSF